jgi:AcrR family transcriptional regulator
MTSSNNDTAPAAASSTPARSRSDRKGSTYAKGDATRKRIIDIAWEAFAERGFRGASMNEIAKTAGVTMAGLIHHFPNKTDLFLSVLQVREAEDQEQLLETLAEEPSGFAVLDGFVATARTNKDRYRFVQLTHLNSAESAPGDHPGADFAKRHYAFSRQLVADAFRRSIARGEVRSDVDPDQLGIEVVAMSEGIENQWLHSPDEIDLPAALERWVEAVKDRVRA